MPDAMPTAAENCFDHTHGGTFTSKGDVWKDASHDGRAWLCCFSLLRP